jgi:hypothetical protein
MLAAVGAVPLEDLPGRLYNALDTQSNPGHPRHGMALTFRS